MLNPLFGQKESRVRLTDKPGINDLLPVHLSPLPATANAVYGATDSLQTWGVSD